MNRHIKIGTRTSALALTQTELVMAMLKEKQPEVTFELIPLKTLGDRILDKPLLSFGGKGAFVSEFEAALLAGEIDLAVHSAKDMPIDLATGLEIVGIPIREDPRDVLITMKGRPLKKQALIGTSSLRRKYQIKALMDVTCKDLRGNINTRLKKLEDGEYDGMILAAAGLKRLGLDHEAKYDYHFFSSEDFVPAGGQGIIAVEGRSHDEISRLVSCINDKAAMLSLKVERKVLKLLEAGCHEPIGVFSSLEGETLHLTLLKGDEERLHRISGSSSLAEVEALATQLVSQLKALMEVDEDE